MKSQLFTRKLWLTAVVVLVSIGNISFAQEEDAKLEAAKEKALAQLKENLLGMSDNVFLREQVLDNGVKFLQLIWQENGESTKLTFELKILGNSGGEPVFSILAYTTVAFQENGAMPPAIIKKVSTVNNQLLLGYFSMTDTFDTVYLNCTAPSDTLTSSQLWMICAYMQQNRIALKKEIDPILSASGR